MTGRKAAATVALVVLAGAAACGDDADEDLPSDTTAPVVSPTEPTVAPTTTVPEQAYVDSVSGVEVGLEEVGVYEEPVALVFRDDRGERAYLGLRRGVVLDLDLASGESTTVLDVSEETTVESERGLLGLALSPGRDHLYVSTTNLDGDSRIDEYAVADDGSLDEGSRRAVFALDQPFANHNGGHLTFGPDGLLYVGLGDGGSAGDPLEAGQDREQLLGSILRIDPNGRDGSAYAVPGDNPYVDREEARPEVWLKGVRNPWRFSFDAATGDLWVGDVGQNDVEEVTLLPAGPEGRGAGRGANLGWSEMEGDQPFEGGVAPDDHTPPDFTYRHADGGCSVTGGVVVHDPDLPDLFGAYVLSDYCDGVLRALATGGGDEVVDDAVIGGVDSPVSFARAPTGAVYVLSQSGPVSRLVPA